MNQVTFQGKWKQMRGALKEEWGKLTNDDLRVIAGRTDQLVGTLQERYGYTREQAENEVQRFLRRYDEPRSVLARWQGRFGRTVRQRPLLAWVAAGSVLLLLAAVLLNQDDDFGFSK